MILRQSSRAVLVAIYAYTVLFAITHVSGRFNYDGVADNETCVPCDRGHHAGDIEHCNCTACEDCPPHDPTCNCSGYCVTDSSCLECEPGHYADKQAMAVCNECPPGTHTDTYGATICSECTPGTYAEDTGQTDCDRCSPGQNASHSRATTCLDCPLGYICNTSGCVDCNPCPAGRSSSVNRTLCDLCAPGRFSPSEGHPCETCGKGYICEDLGCKKCFECPGGEQPQKGVSLISCELCGPGYYRKEGEGLFCKECLPGTFQEHYGQEVCELCPEDHYCPNPTEKHVCPDDGKCPPGRITPIFCPNLYEYDDSKEACTPTMVFIFMIVLIVVFVASLVIVIILAIYCHIYRRRASKLNDEKIPLTKEPVKEPVYDGH